MGAQLAFYLLLVSGPVSLLDVDEVAVVCTPIMMGRWSELMVACVCHSDEVMKLADATYTSTHYLKISILLIIYLEMT